MNAAAAPQQRRRHRPQVDDVSTRTLLIQQLTPLAEGMARESERVREGGDGAVHRLRVHSRRFRSALRTFAPVMRTEECAQARADLGWLADALASLRDLEVVEQRLVQVAAHVGSEPGGSPTPADEGLAWIRPHLSLERDQARAAALAELESDRWFEALARLQELAQDPPTRGRADRPAPDVVPRLVGRQYAALAARARDVQRDSDQKTWHRVRITAKHARNAAELAVPVAGTDARRLAKRLNVLTDLLGELQDTWLVRTELVRLTTQQVNSVEDVDRLRAGFGLGLIHAQEAATADQLRQAFPAVWTDVDRRRYRRWLGA